jgi:hypothetical protein
VNNGPAKYSLMAPSIAEYGLERVDDGLGQGMQ